MKFIFFPLIVLFLFAFADNLFAQQRDITIVLFRHAEKDISPGASKSDPDLSEAGKQRAGRLVEAIKKYDPTQIYSTNFKRTRQTVAPLSEQTIPPGYKRQIQFYDHNELEELAAQILKSKGGTIVVAGHNTTTPTLANLLIKQEKYKYLDESEYDKIFIIKIKGNKIEDEVVKY